MALFKKKKAPQILPGRRRPLEAGSENAPRTPGTMFSYHSQRSGAASNTGRREQLDTVAETFEPGTGLVRYRALILSCSVLVVLILAYVLTLDTKPRIVLLQDAATAYFLQSDEVYNQTVQQTLEQSAFNRNKLTIDTAAVQSKLLSSYPEIKAVSVALPVLGHHPQVYIEPYKPSFILTTTNSNSFLLDATGRALANTSQIGNVDKLGVPTLQDKTGAAVTLGNRAIPSTTVTFVQTVVSVLKAKGVETSTLALPANAYQLDVGLVGQAYYVKFNLESDAMQQAGTLLAVQKRLKAEKVTPGQYIDVRVPERAYYK